MDLPLGRQLALTHKALHAWTDAALVEHGSSLSTWIVLNATAESPSAGRSQRELAEVMSIGAPALVRHLDRLESEGLVARARDEHDRRIVRITLTNAGRRQHRRLRTVITRIDENLRSRLSAADQRTLRSALDTITTYATVTPLPTTGTSSP